MLLGHFGVNIVRIAAVLLAISFFLPWGTIKAGLDLDLNILDILNTDEVGSLSFTGLNAARGELVVEINGLPVVGDIDVTINVPGKTRYYLILLVALVCFVLAFITDALKLNRIIPAVIFGILGLVTVVTVILNWRNLDDKVSEFVDPQIADLVGLQLSLETGVGVLGVIAACIGIMLGAGIMIIEALIAMTRKPQPAEEPIADQPGDLQF